MSFEVLYSGYNPLSSMWFASIFFESMAWMCPCKTTLQNEYPQAFGRKVRNSETKYRNGQKLE